MSENFFPLRPVKNPRIYAFEEPNNPELKGLLKIGYTTKDVRERVAEQYPTSKPGKIPYRIVLEESAIKNDGSTFKDHDIHRYLERHNFIRGRADDGKKTEWFKCSVDDVRAAVIAVREGKEYEFTRSKTFKMRPEQEEAVNKTYSYFMEQHKENPDESSHFHFLWNAKMRFGKTFAAYQLAKKMNWKKILILTFKPAVQDAWETDLKTHVDFEGWQFVCNRKKDQKSQLDVDNLDQTRPIVCFGSFQDFLGKTSAGGIKPKNEWVHTTNWDCVILDEYHFGSWRETPKKLFKNENEKDQLYTLKELVEGEDKKEQAYALGEGIEYFSEDIMPITTKHYLYLSGTPFRSLNSGEFIEEQIFTWTYSEEQRAKLNWKGGDNPYASLPRLVMLTYKLPDNIEAIASKGEFDEFDLNEFFSATGNKENATFKYESEVQKWLDLIRGEFTETTIDNLKLGAKKPPMPFGDIRLKEILTHTFWFLPKISSCFAMANLLKKRNNVFFHDYKIIVAAGVDAGIGIDAVYPVRAAMDNPIKSKTITLSCGKLTTGVSVSPWSGIFMLRNLSTPETYFQAAFRVQTPWVIDNPDDLHPNNTQIMKEECYVFDFAPDRALKQISDYGCRLNLDENISPEQKVEEFIQFLPVLSYDGSCMRQIDGADILDTVVSGTSATLLARRWESALLVNVDNDTLRRLMSNQEALNALMNIEGFRSLNENIETIINKSDNVNQLKKKSSERDLSEKEKKELSEEEKEQKSLRKKIQEKLIKFATRVPIFMYLTDYREQTLKDVITQLEPNLFKKVTGLNIKDFELLVNLGLFNGQLMNDAVYKFKRYEDASLEYTTINRHQNEKNIGLYDTTVSKKDAIIMMT